MTKDEFMDELLLVGRDVAAAWLVVLNNGNDEERSEVLALYRNYRDEVTEIAVAIHGYTWGTALTLALMGEGN